MAYGTIVINQTQCKGCSLCTAVCPQDLLQVDTAIFNAKGYHPAFLNDRDFQCTGCAICAVICPDACITVYREPKEMTQLRKEVAL